MKIRKIKAQDLDELNIPERRKNRIIMGGLKVFSITNDQDEIVANAFVGGRKPIARVVNIEYKKDGLDKSEILNLIMNQATEFFSFVMYVSYEEINVVEPVKRKTGIDVDNEQIYIYYI